MDQQILALIAEIACRTIGSDKMRFFDSGYCGIGFEAGDCAIDGVKVSYYLRSDRSFDRIIVSCGFCSIESLEEKFTYVQDFACNLTDLLDELENEAQFKFERMNGYECDNQL